MHNALRLVKKTFTVGVVLATITWSIGLAAFLMPLAAHAAVAGDLIKASTPAVYYLGSDGKRYVFPNEKTFKTWYSSFSGVKTITDAELASYPIGGNVTYKPGVKMVKITTDPKVYAVDANGKLRHVTSEAIAVALYGSTWNKQIDDVADSFFVNYTTGAAINAASEFVPATVTAAATSINFDKGLGAVAVVTPVGGSGLTVGLAADNPAAVSVVTSDDATTQSASLLPMLALNFTASADGAVSVTSLVFKKGGISADTDVRNVYLYDDAGVRLAEYTSFTSAIVTFTNASGLFSVPAGTTKKVWVKADMAYNVGSGKTVSFILQNAAGVVTNGAAVSGSFPLSGNLVTTAQVTDNAQVLLPTPGAANPTQPGNIDPGVTGREIWRSTLAVSNQKVEVRKIKFLVNGSVTASDLQNLKLSESGVQLGSTAQVASDMTVTFDMSAAPLVIEAGVTKTLSLAADVVGGTNRSFKMSIQKYSDIEVWDTHYGNYVAVDTGTSGGSFTVFENSSSITINTGKVTISRATDSPTGPVAAGATNVDLAKFAIKASGEAIKFSDIRITSDLVTFGTSATTGGLNDVKLLLDGVQVGQTSDIYEGTAKTFTVNFIVPAGVTSYLTVRADVKTADGTSITSGTIAVSMTDGSIGGTAKGQVSLQSATVGTAAGQTVAVNAGTLAVTKNVNFSDRTSTISTGVPNTPNVKIGSFVITAGAGEGSDVTQIVLDDTSDQYSLGDDFQNLKLMHGSTQIGTTIGSLNTTESTYTFTPASAISLAASEQYVVDVYADILSTVTNSADDYAACNVTSVSATGKVTSSATSWTTGSLALQLVYINTSGTLTITAAADTPTNDTLVLGSTGNVLAKFRFAANAVEDITVNKIFLSDRIRTDGGAAAATGTVRNISLWDGTTQVGSTVASLSETNNNVTPYATFSGLSWNIPRNSAKTLTVKADYSTVDDGGVTSSTTRFVLATGYTSASTAVESVEARGASSGTSLTGSTLVYTSSSAEADVVGNYFDVLKTKLTIAYAADAPSGLSAASAEQTVAKFVVSNTANAGNYTALVKLMDFNVSSYGSSISGATNLKVYKDSVAVANQLAATPYCHATSLTSDACPASAAYRATGIGAGNFTDVYVAAGSSVTVIVTIGTNNSGFATNETLTVGINAGAVTWGDDAYAASVPSYTMVMSLPLAGKTLYY